MSAGKTEQKLPGQSFYPLLLPLSWLYVLGLQLYLLLYRLGMRKQHRLKCAVVCVGNLTFGGTGKTPVVISMAQQLRNKGLNVVVLSRGHKGKLSGKGALVSDGTGRKLTAEECGDEPALIADALPGVPVVIGKNRVKAGRHICEEFSPDVILMDDGMQYWQLHKDVVIALVDANQPFGPGWVMPAGSLREPKSGLKRASAVVITGVHKSDNIRIASLERELKAINEGADVYTACHVPDSLVKIGTGEKAPFEDLKGLDVAALSSIGSPESFERTLESLGARVVERLRYPDHYRYTEKDIKHIHDKAGDLQVVTTAKDAVRLDPQLIPNALVLSVRMEIDKSSHLVESIIRGINK